MANRGYHKGFLMGTPSHDAQNYQHSNSRNYSQKFSALLLEKDPLTGRLKVDVRSRMKKGEKIELISPELSQIVEVEKMINRHGEEVVEAHPGAGHYEFDLSYKGNLEPYSILTSFESSGL